MPTKNLTGFAVHESRLATHYYHALEKHPHFADRLAQEATLEAAHNSLLDFRGQLTAEMRRGECYAETVMLCELWEAFAAIAADQKADVVNELYDAAAVLLRMVDVFEGRQKLGKEQLKSPTDGRAAIAETSEAKGGSGCATVSR